MREQTIASLESKAKKRLAFRNEGDEVASQCHLVQDHQRT